MHMVSTNDLTAEEGETIRNSKESSGYNDCQWDSIYV